MKRLVKVLCAVAALCLAACNNKDNGGENFTPDTTIASLGTPSDNEIWFTTFDKRPLMALEEGAFDAEITNIEYSEEGVNTITFADRITCIGEDAFNYCRNLNNISLPESITTVGDRAFYECTGLECMTLGANIKSFGKDAFDNCIALYSLHISSIGDWCLIEFANYTANPVYHSGSFVINGKIVTSINIPSWVSRIGDYAFYNYDVMAGVNIPKSIKSIGKDAFCGCEGLAKVDIEDASAWSQIEFATALSNPFSYASSLYINGQAASAISLVGVESVSARAFQGCSNIKSVVTDNSLKVIGEEAFRGCDGLTQVTLGTAVEEIGGRAFMGCSALKSVKCPVVEPPVLCDEYVFDYNAEDRKIYVPKDAYDKYVASPYWSKYAESLISSN